MGIQIKKYNLFWEKKKISGEGDTFFRYKVGSKPRKHAFFFYALNFIENAWGKKHSNIREMGSHAKWGVLYFHPPLIFEKDR